MQRLLRESEPPMKDVRSRCDPALPARHQHPLRPDPPARGTVAATLARRGHATACTSIIAAAELHFGARKRGSAALTAKVDDLLAALPVLPLDADVDRTYAETRFHLEQSGTPIGPNDLLIAVHALSLGLTAVTDNDGEFSRVPGLLVENWLIARAGQQE